MSLAVLMAAVVVSVALRSQPGRVLPAEVATNSLGDAQRYSSGQQGSATKNSSSHKHSWPYSSGAPLGEGKDEGVKEPQAVLEQEADPQNSRSQNLNRQASKHLLRHPLGRSPNHTSSADPTTNSDFLVALKAGSGQSPPKQSYRAPAENAATKCFQQP